MMTTTMVMAKILLFDKNIGDRDSDEGDVNDDENDEDDEDDDYYGAGAVVMTTMMMMTTMMTVIVVAMRMIIVMSTQIVGKNVAGDEEINE